MFVDDKAIDTLRVAYNKEHSREPPIPTGNIRTTWDSLRRRLRSKCKDGAAECVVSSLLAKPKAPESWKENPTEWLSTAEIDKIEKSYTKLFSSYNYVGAFPMDFGAKSETGSCLVSALCSMDIRKLAAKGKTQIGIIFNTDLSTGPGKHWVAVFCDVSPDLEYPRMTYFDSYGHYPEKEIQRLMKRWKEQWDAGGGHSTPMELTYNKTKHQRKGTECGMYSVYFHYCCLTGIPMETRIPDDVMTGLRGAMYRI